MTMKKLLLVLVPLFLAPLLMVVLAGPAAAQTVTGNNGSALVRVNGDVTAFSGFWIIGLLLMIGWAILVILAGLVFAAVAPDLARRAGRTISSDLGPTIVGGLVLWVVLPVASILAFATIIGIPTAVAVWLIVLPALAFVGFLVAGIRVGERIATRGSDGVGHPYLASVLGLGTLVVVGALPIIGPIVAAVAGFLGSGSLAVQALRAVRTQPHPNRPISVTAQP